MNCEHHQGRICYFFVQKPKSYILFKVLYDVNGLINLFTSHPNIAPPPLFSVLPSQAPPPLPHSVLLREEEIPH